MISQFLSLMFTVVLNVNTMVSSAIAQNSYQRSVFLIYPGETVLSKIVIVLHCPSVLSLFLFILCIDAQPAHFWSKMTIPTGVFLHVECKILQLCD